MSTVKIAPKKYLPSGQAGGGGNNNDGVDIVTKPVLEGTEVAADNRMKTVSHPSGQGMKTVRPR